jgi:hypothetical protein
MNHKANSAEVKKFSDIGYSEEFKNKNRSEKNGCGACCENNRKGDGFKHVADVAQAGAIIMAKATPPTHAGKTAKVSIPIVLHHIHQEVFNRIFSVFQVTFFVLSPAGNSPMTAPNVTPHFRRGAT